MLKLHPHQWDILLSMKANKGQIISPTGSGKTLTMIEDCKRFMFNLKGKSNKTVVVVAPRILLASQLSNEFLQRINEDNVKVLHVHSGETRHFSSTNADTIKQWDKDNCRYNKLIFTTYHSLHRLKESGINVDTVYYDESHNSTAKNFYPAVKHYSEAANRSYYFTATPKHSYTNDKAGMNDEKVYGKVLKQVSAPKLVDKGIILSPKVIVKKIEVQDDNVNVPKHIIDTIDEINVKKVLVCARSTKQIVSLASSNMVGDLQSRGYSLLYITAKTGAFIDGKKVSRDKFFDVLNTWGKDSDKKFIVLHHSILSEGISVRGLEAAFLLRNMDIITLSQTIGRVIRTNGDKKHGLVVVPSYDKVGISTAKRLSNVVETIFQKGEAATQIVRR